MADFKELMLALHAAFYGTPVKRDGKDGSMRKFKSAGDGWRDGKSHPFKYDGETYDVKETADLTFAQFEMLADKIRKDHPPVMVTNVGA